METANFNHLICFAMACLGQGERAKFLARVINALDTLSLAIADPISSDRVSTIFGYDAALQSQFQLWLSNPENQLRRGMPVKIWTMLHVLLGTDDQTLAEREHLEMLATQIRADRENYPDFANELRRSMRERNLIIAGRVRFEF